MTKKPAVRRGRKPIPDKERKDALVQTRVPDELSQTLREAAKKNRVTVSQLIRNVLEDTFDLVDNVVSEAVSLGQTAKRDALKIAETAKGRGTRRAAPPVASPPVASSAVAAALESVDAWQGVKLNRDAECARCGRLMSRGESALFGIGDDAHKVWLCLSCGSQI